MINVSMAEPDNMLRPRILVIGVGGAGGNAINSMIRSNLMGCDFIAANTDSQALAQSLAQRKIQLGINLSRGLGAGSKPDLGRSAAEEQMADIMAHLEGSDMLFVTAGMGGGTGTGAAPVIARAARDSGILTVGVVTKPFHFEGSQRMKQAEAGIAELQQYVDTLIVIPNQNLFRIANERTTLPEAFRLADEVLHSGVRGITDLMVMPGFMNLDFADVKTVMGEMGKAMMGTGEAEGENRAIRAAEAAISNPLLDDISMKGARGVLINITGGLDMTLFEIDQAANRIREEVDPEAQIKVGSTLGEDLGDKIRVSVIATGIDVAVADNKSQKSSSSSGVMATPRPVAQPVQRTASAFAQSTTKMAATTPPPVNAGVNLSSSYFTMPQPVTPQMMVPQPVAQTPLEETQSAEASDVSEVALPRVAMASPSPSFVPAQQSSAQAYQSPIGNAAYTQQQTRNAPPARAPSSDTNADGDMRITQLTVATDPSASSASLHVNQRSQSLFKRITGFGMVRPSAQTEEEFDDGQANAQHTKQPRLGIDPSDRPTIAGETTDELDIPAFLRRQNNH